VQRKLEKKLTGAIGAHIEQIMVKRIESDRGPTAPSQVSKSKGSDFVVFLSSVSLPVESVEKGLLWFCSLFLFLSLISCSQIDGYQVEKKKKKTRKEKQQEKTLRAEQIRAAKKQGVL
jgi:hypothetical protein